jgi:hypothetical protein
MPTRMLEALLVTLPLGCTLLGNGLQWALNTRQ